MPNKTTTLFFLIESKFRKMANNKHVDLRKIKNFARNKYYPKDISKHKGKKTNFRKSCKNVKSFMGII